MNKNDKEQLTYNTVSTLSDTIQFLEFTNKSATAQLKLM